MRIEFLYFTGCPSWKRALEDLREVMEEMGIDDEIEMVEIKTGEDVQRHRFLGSPSIRVNGRDIEERMANDTDYSMRCRVYRNGLMLEAGLQRRCSRGPWGECPHLVRIQKNRSSPPPPSQGVLP
jgi:hypothetical protein